MSSSINLPYNTIYIMRISTNSIKVYVVAAKCRHQTECNRSELGDKLKRAVSCPLVRGPYPRTELEGKERKSERWLSKRDKVGRTVPRVGSGDETREDGSLVPRPHPKIFPIFWTGPRDEARRMVPIDNSLFSRPHPALQ